MDRKPVPELEEGVPGRLAAGGGWSGKDLTPSAQAGKWHKIAC